MRFAAIIKAEEGWLGLLTDPFGRPLFISVVSWGVVASLDRSRIIPGSWWPIDEFGECISDRGNFVMLLHTEEDHDALSNQAYIKKACAEKARELKAPAKSDT